MPPVNLYPPVDVRKVLSGKDGGVYDEDGELLASAETFQSQVAVNNATYQPLGDPQEHGAMTSYRVTLNFTEIIIESGRFIQLLIQGMAEGRMPALTFRGMMKSPYNDSEEQMIYRDCVPDGNIDLQNMQVGELYKRPWSWIVNKPPELQSLLVNN